MSSHRGTGPTIPDHALAAAPHVTVLTTTAIVGSFGRMASIR